VERTYLLAGRPQPGGRDPAPGALALVQDFVNTVDREHGPDLLDDAAGFLEWLSLRDLGGAPSAPPPISTADLDRARELREALRVLLLANHGNPVPEGVRGVLEQAADRAGLRVRLPPEGAALVPVSNGVDGALGQVVSGAVVAMWDGTWRRLKACPRSVCQWAFYDRSTNASATWCSMSICGGREKASRYYRRSRHNESAI
jgi:predicted RNA-binding Zn ribbon-like protein